MPWFKPVPPARPCAIADPELGELTPLLPAAPEGTVHWEGEWRFPPTGNTVYIGLPGDSGGPAPAAREFLLGLPYRHSRTWAAAQAAIAAAQSRAAWPVVEAWVLSGFHVESVSPGALCWSMALDAPGGGTGQVFISFSNETVCDVEYEP
jgi:hypothetical protein